MTALSPADEMHAAADAMRAEADRLDAMDRDAEQGPWRYADVGSDEAPVLGPMGVSIAACSDCYERADVERPTADLVVHRRNTVARDAATLRATAALLQDAAQATDEGWGYVPRVMLAVARAFMGEADRG